MTLIIPPPSSVYEPKEGIDFEYVENQARALTFKIIKGQYSGVIYMYEYVKLTEPKEEKVLIESNYDPFVDEELEDKAKLSFDYSILQNITPDVRHQWEFELLIGKILSTVLTDATTNANSKYSAFVKDNEGKIVMMAPLENGSVKDMGFFDRIMKKLGLRK